MLDGHCVNTVELMYRPFGGRQVLLAGFVLQAMVNNTRQKETGRM
jgi:hypothetical protein